MQKIKAETKTNYVVSVAIAVGHYCEHNGRALSSRNRHVGDWQHLLQHIHII